MDPSVALEQNSMKTKNRISELEKRWLELIQSEQQRENKQTNKKIFRD